MYSRVDPFELPCYCCYLGVYRSFSRDAQNPERVKLVGFATLNMGSSARRFIPKSEAPGIGLQCGKMREKHA